MRFRATFLVAVVIAAAGVAWNLARQPSEPTVVTASEPPLAASVEKWAAALPLDSGARESETRDSASSGIDCTRGLACPIIWSPPKGK